MARKTASGIFTPKNPEKYIGANGKNIQYRSSWELQVFNFLDTTKSILGWASEAVSVPYVNPLTGKTASYIPDLLVVYQDRSGNKKADMIEIKPAKESPLYEGRVSYQTKLVQAINAAKWMVAAAYCKKRGLNFRVMTENDMFGHRRNA